MEQWHSIIWKSNTWLYRKAIRRACCQPPIVASINSLFTMNLADEVCTKSFSPLAMSNAVSKWEISACNNKKQQERTGSPVNSCLLLKLQGHAATGPSFESLMVLAHSICLVFFFSSHFPFLFPPWDRTMQDLIKNSVAEVPMQEPLLQNLMVQISITLLPAATRASFQISPYIHFVHIATPFPWSTYDWASGHLSISDINILRSNRNSFAALLHLQPDKNAVLEGAEWWNLTTYQ